MYKNTKKYIETHQVSEQRLLVNISDHAMYEVSFVLLYFPKKKLPKFVHITGYIVKISLNSRVQKSVVKSDLRLINSHVELKTPSVTHIFIQKIFIIYRLSLRTTCNFFWLNWRQGGGRPVLVRAGRVHYCVLFT